MSTKQMIPIKKTNLSILKCYFLLLLLCNNVSGQSKIRYRFDALGIATTDGQVPFWLKANQHGSIPLDGLSGSIINNLYRKYDTTNHKIADWGFSLEARANLGKRQHIILTEGYAKFRLAIIELKAGRAKDITGITDSVLSTGSFSVSGNALGIPKIELSIPEYYSIPILGKIFAIKGGISHGWVGRMPINYIYRKTNTAETYLHQKFIYGRFGKPNWFMKFYAGLNHQAYWGNENKIFSYRWNLTQLETFRYVFTGQTIDGDIAEKSKVGNHLGSIDFGFEFNFKKLRVLLYRQNFYEVGSLYYLQNIRDGLNGISLVNTSKEKDVRIDRVLFEVLYTKNQGGELYSKVTPSGDENYYNNYVYAQGWSYHGIGIGTPFINPQNTIRKELPAIDEYFVNNRVIAFHTGVQATAGSFNGMLKLSYSKNYGTYGTSAIGHSIAHKRYPAPSNLHFPETEQFSAILDIRKKFNSGIIVGVIYAMDYGKLYYNSNAGILTISKTF